MREDILGVLAGPLFVFFGVRLVALARTIDADARARASDELDSLMADLPGPHPFQLRLFGWFFTVGGTAVFAISLYQLIARGGT